MELPGTMQIDTSGQLVIGGVTARKLALRFGTPLYVYDEELIRKRCREYMKAFSLLYPRFSLAFAGKAFMTMAVARIMEEEGLGLDLVSGGEIHTALKAGFPPSRIQFNGSNKSDAELTMAVGSGVGRVIVDGFWELEALDRIARNHGIRQDILLRIAPGVEAHTHEFIQTGKEDSKFGFTLAEGQAMEAVRRALTSASLNLRGLHCHVGSQVFDLTPFGLAVEKMMDFRASVYRKTQVILEEINMGGGLGIPYLETDAAPTIKHYAEVLTGKATEEAKKQGMPLPILEVEPGRSIVGEAGITLYTIGAIKEVPGIRTYISVDGGMTDNIRPALYDASYTALLADRANEEPSRRYSVVGRCCESGDMLIKEIDLPEVRRGDLLAVFSTGAYHYSMASNYNRYPKPAVVMAREGCADLIVARETYEDIVANDRIPPHLRRVSKERALGANLS